MKKALGILFLFCCFNGYSQISMWEMNNFKKLEKSREKKQKNKGSNISSKKRLHKPKKVRKSKDPFLKRKYKVELLKEDEIYLA